MGKEPSAMTTLRAKHESLPKGRDSRTIIDGHNRRQGEVRVLGWTSRYNNFTVGEN